MSRDYKIILAVAAVVLAAMCVSFFRPSTYNFIGDYYRERGDMEKSEAFYGFSAESGDRDGQFAMSVFAAERKDYGKAREWSEKAADQGLPEAMYNMGVYCIAAKAENVDEAALDEAMKWFRRASSAGFAKADYSLGMCYDEKSEKFDRGKAASHKASAFRCFERAAGRGYEKASLEVAGRLLYGDGTPKDEKRAFELFKAASDGGDRHGRYYEAFCLSEGLGVDADRGRALQIVRDLLKSPPSPGSPSSPELEEMISALEKKLSRSDKESRAESSGSGGSDTAGSAGSGVEKT